MSCQICGDTRSAHRDRSRMSLCNSCHRGTPAKATREEFDRLYWASDDPAAERPPESIRREFYSDYKASKYKTVEAYIVATTSYC